MCARRGGWVVFGGCCGCRGWLFLAAGFGSWFADGACLLLLHLQGTPVRVVAVASKAHTFGKIDLEDLNWEKRGYNRWLRWV